MKNQTKTVQGFPFTLKPATITSGAHQGETEIRLQEKFVPSKTEGEARVAPASVGVKNGSANALFLFRRDEPIKDTEKLQGLCIVRTAEGLQAGQLTGHHVTADGTSVSIAGLKRLAGRSLALARLAAVKSQLALKYGRLAVKSGSKGRTVVLTHKALTFRRAANSQWFKIFTTLAKPAASASRKQRAN
jgi:hypothetical protein